MEINNEILSGIKLINSAHINKDDLVEIFDESNKALFGASGEQDCMGLQSAISDDRLILLNVITFSIKALLLEAAKHNINESSLIQLLAQDHNLDCNTENFQLFIQFINSTLKKVGHNVENLQLNPLPKFKNLEWSQSIDVKSSIVDSIKEKSYIIDLQVDVNVDQNTNREETFSMALSSKELQDLYSSLRDCVKNVENFVNK